MTANLKRILSELEGMSEVTLDPEGLRLLVAELRDELDKPAVLWPEGVIECVAEHISQSVYNPESRTFKSLDRRIAWVVGTWMDRHGPMNDEQRQYMSDVLCWAIRTAAKEAGTDKRKLYSFTLTKVSGLINDDRVADGFKRRARTVDVSSLLAGAA